MVVRDVPDNMTYVGVRQRKLESSINKDSFEAYGISKGKIDDPNKKSISVLFKELHVLNEKDSVSRIFNFANVLKKMILTLN